MIVDEKRVWTSAKVRGWSATRELVSVQEGSNIVPISDAIWREIQRGWDVCAIGARVCIIHHELG